MILNVLKEQDTVMVQELVESLNVSEITVRRDLDLLEKSKKLIRTRGGARLAAEDPHYLNQRYEMQSTMNLEGKKAIGKLAASMVLHGETIVIDSGSTAIQLARHLHNKRGVTALVTAVNIAEVLEGREGVNTILAGGVYRAKTAALTSPFLENFFTSIYADKVFLGVTKFCLEFGFSGNDFYEYGTKKLILNAGREVYWLADSTKLNEEDAKANIHISSLQSNHHIITDKGIQPEVREQLERVCHLHVAQ